MTQTPQSVGLKEVPLAGITRKEARTKAKTESRWQCRYQRQQMKRRQRSHQAVMVRHMAEETL